MAAEPARRYKPVKAGTHMHAVLDILQDSELTAKEIANRIPSEYEDTTGTTGARRAWKLRYADREKDYERKGNPYVYTLTEIGEQEIDGAPDLVMEVVSPSTSHLDVFDKVSEDVDYKMFEGED